jgi:hypothetical protein
LSLWTIVESECIPSTTKVKLSKLYLSLAVRVTPFIHLHLLILPVDQHASSPHILVPTPIFRVNTHPTVTSSKPTVHFDFGWISKRREKVFTCFLTKHCISVESSLEVHLRPSTHFGGQGTPRPSHTGELKASFVLEHGENGA